jgi:hypothetical protein
MLTALSFPASAGQLVIQVDSQAAVQDGQVRMSLKVANHGDEPAVNIQAQALATRHQVKSRLVASLPPGQIVELNLSWPHSQSGQGRFAAVARVGFQDLNQYPFTAMAYAYYSLGPDRPCALSVRPQPQKLAGRKQVQLRLKNPEPKPVPGRLQAFAPREISLKPSAMEITLPGRGEADTRFELENFSSLKGATYPVLFLWEEKGSGIHTAKVIEIPVTVVEQTNFFKRTMSWWLAVCGFLAALFVFFHLRARRSA